MSSEQKDLKIPEKIATMLIQGYCLVTESCSKCKGLLIRSKSDELICVKCFCEQANRKSLKHGHSDEDENENDGDEKKSETKSVNKSKSIKLEIKENSGQSNQSTITRAQLEDFYRDFYRDLQQLKSNQNSLDIVKYFDSSNEKRK
ncbi:uncharacterized protein LOC128391024 [Panonychus citri]|uniref:uncharacterized protein LOC128391024 n=1 Tax=Panonychus citri TaxID=50023 RepID=UPI002307F425|nr:uncharacterized protein LOC128391024 [Panonychus citri]